MNVKQIDLHVFSVMFSYLPSKGLCEHMYNVYTRSRRTLPSVQKDWDLVWFFPAHYSKVKISHHSSSVRVYFVSVNIPAKPSRSGACVCRVCIKRVTEGARTRTRRDVLIIFYSLTVLSVVWWFRNWQEGPSSKLRYFFGCLITEEFEFGERGLYQNPVTAFAWRDWRNPEIPTVRIAGTSVEIQSCYLRNTSLHCYHVSYSDRESRDGGTRDVNMSGPQAHDVVTWESCNTFTMEKSIVLWFWNVTRHCLTAVHSKRFRDERGRAAKRRERGANHLSACGSNVRVDLCV